MDPLFGIVFFIGGWIVCYIQMRYGNDNKN